MRRAGDAARRRSTPAQIELSSARPGRAACCLSRSKRRHPRPFSGSGVHWKMQFGLALLSFSTHSACFAACPIRSSSGQLFGAGVGRFNQTRQKLWPKRRRVHSSLHSSAPQRDKRRDAADAEERTEGADRKLIRRRPRARARERDRKKKEGRKPAGRGKEKKENDRKRRPAY